MVDANAGRESASAASDASQAFASALRDLWSFGTAALETALGEGGLGRAAESLRSYLGPVLRGVQSFGNMPESSAGRWQPAGQALDAAGVLSQAYLIAAASGLRYWRRLAESYDAHQSAALRSLPALAADAGLSEQERRVLVDEFRAYLREMGDIASQEARLFQAQLERLAAAAADPPEGTEPPATYQRRWRAKP